VQEHSVRLEQSHGPSLPVEAADRDRTAHLRQAPPRRVPSGPRSLADVTVADVFSGDVTTGFS
jgi:hypothetical protein